MSYSISASNWEFDSCIFENEKTIIIGIPHRAVLGQHDCESSDSLQTFFDDVALVPEHPCDAFVNIDGYASRFLALSHENRNIVSTLMSKLIDDGIMQPHVGCNLSAVLNFLSARYQVGLSKIVVIEPMPARVSPDSDPLDRINKLRKTAKPGRNKWFLNYLCAYYLITPSVLYSGNGTLYTVRKPENVSCREMENFHNRVVKRIVETIDNEDEDFHINIKELLLQDRMISETNIEEWKMQTFFRFWNVPKDAAMIIDYLLDNLK